MDYRVLLAAPLAALVMSVSAMEPHLPLSWIQMQWGSPGPGNTVDMSKGPNVLYDIGLDPKAQEQGLRSLSIKSVGKLSTEAVNLGVAEQAARGYAGKRLRFSGQIRSEAVNTWAGLYLSLGDSYTGVLPGLVVGSEDAEKSLPPNGAAGQPPYDAWQDVSVVVQVPATVNSVGLGLALVGEGQVWARKLSFEVVGPEVPLTSTRMLGFDWAKARDKRVRSEKFLSTLPPQPLTNLALD
jgi:hypothetical protein